VSTHDPPNKGDVLHCDATFGQVLAIRHKNGFHITTLQRWEEVLEINTEQIIVGYV